MNVSIGPRWEEFVSKAVETGRYGSASEVVREGLRLVEEREARLQALRESLELGDRGRQHGIVLNMSRRPCPRRSTRRSAGARAK